MVPPKRVFQLPFESHTLIGDVISDRDTADLLMLHGAGQSNRSAFDLLRLYFWEHGISTAAFDFIGHGETGGRLTHSSLKSRTEQVCRVIDALHLSPPLSIWAASMSGYTAVKLLEHYEIAHLVLLVPAMYTADAYEVRFDQGFSELIRSPNSWEQSDAWALLGHYTGQLMIVSAENDAVIPPGVIRRIHEAAVRAQTHDLFVAPGASHSVITDLRAQQPGDLNQLLDAVTAMVSPHDC